MPEQDPLDITTIARVVMDALGPAVMEYAERGLSGEQAMGAAMGTLCITFAAATLLAPEWAKEMLEQVCSIDESGDTLAQINESARNLTEVLAVQAIREEIDA